MFMVSQLIPARNDLCEAHSIEKNSLNSLLRVFLELLI